jgi:hypothetical protein
MSKFLLFGIHITLSVVLCCAGCCAVIFPGTAVLAQETADFDKWTQADLNEIGVYVKKLLTDIRNSTDTARNELLAKTLAALSKIAASEEVKPAVRYNAVLVIGQLVQKEAEASGTPPTPYSAALPYLVETYQNGNTPEYVRVGALLGIVRHAYCGIADQNLRQTVIPNLLIGAVMSGRPTEEGGSQGSREVIDWSRRIALEGLGALKSADAKIVDTLLNIMEGEKDSFDMRTLAAKTFGDLDLKDAASRVDGAKIGNALLALTKSFFGGELVKVTTLREDFYPEVRRDREEKEELELRREEAKRRGRPLPSEPRQPRRDPRLDRLENDPDYKTLSAEQKEAVREMIIEMKLSLQNIRYGITGAVTGKVSAGIRPVLQDDNEVAGKLDLLVRGIDLFLVLLDEGPPMLPEKKVPGAAKTTSKSSSTTKSKSRGGTSEEDYERQQEAGMRNSGPSSNKPGEKDDDFKVNLSIIQKGLKAALAALEAGKEFPKPLVEPIEKPLSRY